MWTKIRHIFHIPKSVRKLKRSCDDNRSSLQFLEEELYSKTKHIHNIQFNNEDRPNEINVTGSRYTQYNYKLYEQKCNVNPNIEQDYERDNHRKTVKESKKMIVKEPSKNTIIKKSSKKIVRPLNNSSINNQKFYNRTLRVTKVEKKRRPNSV